MEGMKEWPPTDHPKPAPPDYVKMSGRPRKERRREEGEIIKGTKMSRIGLKTKCSRCHNTTTCPAAPKGNIMRTLGRAREISESSQPQKRGIKSGDDNTKPHNNTSIADTDDFGSQSTMTTHVQTKRV